MTSSAIRMYSLSYYEEEIKVKIKEIIECLPGPLSPGEVYEQTLRVLNQHRLNKEDAQTLSAYILQVAKSLGRL